MLRRPPAFNLKLEPPTLDSTAYVRDSPSVWIDLLKTASYAALAYLEKWNDVEIVSFMTQPKVLEAVVQYLVEFDLKIEWESDINYQSKEGHLEKMRPRCHQGHEYLSSYNSVPCIMFTRDGRMECTAYSFMVLYNQEVNRAKAIAKKLQEVLNTQSAEGALDLIFKRRITAGLGVGSPRPISVGLLTSKQYTLMQAIYKHLSTGILIPELIIGNTGSVFSSLVNTLPDGEVHPLLSALIAQISADQTTLLSWKRGIPRAILTKLEKDFPSLYGKWLKATTPPSIAGTHERNLVKIKQVGLNANEIELGSIKPNETTNANNQLEEENTEVLFGDNMPLSEVIIGNMNGNTVCPVIYKSVENDVFENPEKLLKIAERNATLAHMYLDEIFIDRSYQYINIINSKNLLSKLSSILINKIPSSNHLCKIMYFLDSESLKTLFIKSTSQQWELFQTSTCHLLLGVVTEDNAIELLKEFKFNLLEILIKKLKFTSAQGLYRVASRFYVDSENDNTSTACLTDWINEKLTSHPDIKQQDSLSLKGIIPSVMKSLLTNAYRKNDNSFVEFCNKNYFSMANYLYLFEADDEYIEMRERVFLSLNARSWDMLAKSVENARFNRVSYLMSAITPENSERVLNGLNDNKVDLLGILVSGPSKREARQLYLKNPSCLEKILGDETNRKFGEHIMKYLHSTEYPSGELTCDNEYKLVAQQVIAYTVLNHSDNFIIYINYYRTIMTKLLLCFSDAQMDAFVALDESFDLFDKVHDTFKEQTPLLFIQKAGTVCPAKLLTVSSLNNRFEVLRQCPDNKASLIMFLSNALTRIITAFSTTHNVELACAFNYIDDELDKLSTTDKASCLQNINSASLGILLEKSPDKAKQLYQTGRSYFDSCENDEIKAAVSFFKKNETISERLDSLETSWLNMKTENDSLKIENVALKFENTTLKANAPATAVSTLVSFQGSNTTAYAGTGRPRSRSW